ncbi:growth-regulated alpha protein-like [Thalassophryne amazonica]|uniref:growth-regulated alpha protein-like n=1 Tax=Thalassophryne amazonica TaxID=390379 RepID=UPI001470D3F7|nr:growth-regulated alpha protein-like [Thalassophryne amazonica]
MNAAALFLLLLLTSVAVFTSAGRILSDPDCLCAETAKSLNVRLIATAREYGPRPHCSRTEVIATLKDKTTRCLDPSSGFTQAVLQTVKAGKVRRVALQMAKIKATTAGTTAKFMLSSLPSSSP